MSSQTLTVLRAGTPEEAGELAAEVVDAALDGAEAVLGVATGSSPLPLYAALSRRQARDHSRLRAFALDEYVGLPPGHPESYRAVVEREVVVPLGLDPARVRVPDGSAADPHRASEEFEAAREAAGGVDVQILGIGANGHLAFNEPGSPFDSRTRVVELAERTRRDNSRFFGGDVAAVPRQAITQGLATIMSSRALVLIATGEAKAEAVAAMLHGEVSERVPASVIRRHPAATIVLDAAAASLL